MSLILFITMSRGCSSCSGHVRIHRIRAIAALHAAARTQQAPQSQEKGGRSHSNTTVDYGKHERTECIPEDSGVTNLIHDRRSCVDFTLEVEANVARCVHSSVNRPGVKRISGLWDVYPCRLYCGDREQ